MIVNVIGLPGLVDAATTMASTGAWTWGVPFGTSDDWDWSAVAWGVYLGKVGWSIIGLNGFPDMRFISDVDPGTIGDWEAIVQSNGMRRGFAYNCGDGSQYLNILIFLPQVVCAVLNLAAGALLLVNWWSEPHVETQDIEMATKFCHLGIWQFMAVQAEGAAPNALNPPWQVAPQPIVPNFVITTWAETAKPSGLLTHMPNAWNWCSWYPMIVVEGADEVAKMNVLTEALKDFSLRKWLLWRNRKPVLARKPTTTVPFPPPDGTLENATERYARAVQMLSLSRMIHFQDLEDERIATEPYLGTVRK